MIFAYLWLVRQRSFSGGRWYYYDVSITARVLENEGWAVKERSKTLEVCLEYTATTAKWLILVARAYSPFRRLAPIIAWFRSSTSRVVKSTAVSSPDEYPKLERAVLSDRTWRFQHACEGSRISAAWLCKWRRWLQCSCWKSVKRRKYLHLKKYELIAADKCQKVATRM